MSNIAKIRSLLGMQSTNTAIVTITPETANKLLQFNTHNRPVNNKRVKEYEADIRNGKWCLSESVIGFSADGVLTNGQTRLLACINADKSFDSIVCTCLEQSIHMDTGNVRKVIDNIILNGDADNYINVNANSLKVVCEIIRMKNGQARVAPETVVNFCKSYGSFIDKAYDCGLIAMNGTEKGLFRVQIAAAFLVALMNGVESSTLTHIRTLLTSGMTSEESEQVIINWRTSLVRLSSGAGTNSKVNRRQIYLGTQHMIHSIDTGKGGKRIKTDVEYYPVL